MCMLKLSSRLKATKDIVCYKVCICNTDKIYSLHYRDFIWELNKEYTADRAKIYYLPDYVYDGYFHTFNKIEYALKEKEEGSFKIYTKVYKCIIPSGAYYYKGLHQDGKEGYASKKLKIVEEI